ncbi:MAG: FISUMP domain-containing protein [Draconibacterium sp.]
MKKLLFITILLLILWSCEKDKVPEIPSVKITSITEITANSAQCIAEISNDGGETPIRGVCWGINQQPTTDDGANYNGAGIGSFTSSITGLNPGTVYYVRAYATNSVGTGYSSQLNFTTLALLPIVSTTDLSSVTSTSAISGGNISNDGGAQITARGVCWGKNPNPTTSDNKTIDGTGIGNFSSNITGLTTNTVYYLRAYATNIQGTAYGNQISFKISNTGNNTITDIEGNVYKTVTIGNQTWMAEDLRTKKYRNGDPIPYVSDKAEWSALTSGAYGISAFGTKLYNWYAVADSRNLAPEGWHVPTNQDWVELSNFLNGINEAGGKLKETGFTHWFNPNTGATNVSGFTAIPSGCRTPTGDYSDIQAKGMFWTTAPVRISVLSYANSKLLLYVALDVKTFGCSIRCVKD